MNMIHEINHIAPVSHMNEKFIFLRKTSHLDSL